MSRHAGAPRRARRGCEPALRRPAADGFPVRGRPSRPSAVHRQRLLDQPGVRLAALRGDRGQDARRGEGGHAPGRAGPARDRRPGARAQQVCDAGPEDRQGRGLRCLHLDRRGRSVTPTTGRWLSVAKAQNIPVGGSVIVRLDDVPVAVFHLADGWYAIEDVCTHDGGPVAEGRLEGCIIECPRHGATFDIKTGAALTFPAVSPVATYAVRVVGDDVQVEWP